MKFSYDKPDFSELAARLSSQLAISSKQIAVYFNAALAGKAGLEMDRYHRKLAERLTYRMSHMKLLIVLDAYIFGVLEQ